MSAIAIIIIMVFESLKINLNIAFQLTSNYFLPKSQILSNSPYMLYTFVPSLSPLECHCAFLHTSPLDPAEIYIVRVCPDHCG